MTILARLDVVEHVLRNQFAVCVVAVRVVRLEDAQTVLDRQPGRDDKKAAREVLAAGTANRVDRLPGDEHRHDRRLAGAGGELQRETLELRIGVLVRAARCSRMPLPADEMRRDLSQPDGRLDRLDLAEERANVAELVMPPVLQEPRGLRRDLRRRRQTSPLVDVLANPLMIEVGSYCCFCVESPLPSSKTICC